ncbi:hypothetical protein EQG61_02875 [Flavobacterium stagni]|uniref:Lipocalin-like domain-containing protein n=2 Tax=Flavobacterium stagni TaxID=2506421 RepID=A0A4Q1KBW6_9FLAO|nr:hypothetical protein EQG61_02875 [Flavobacterium stagni]
MKKIILFALVTFSMLSCSKSDSDTPAVSIVGKWQFTQEGTLVNNQEVLTPYEHSPGCVKDFTEFLSSGALKDHYYNTSCNESIDTGVWSKTENSLNITYSDNTVVNGQILELSNTTLKVKFIDSGITNIVILTRI